MIPAAAGVGALLFLARWRGSLTGLGEAWGVPFAATDWAGAAGRLGLLLLILAATLVVFAGVQWPGRALLHWLKWRGRIGRGAVTWALGLSVVAAVWEGLGLAGRARGPLAWTTALVLAAAGIPVLRGLAGSFRIPTGAGWLAAAALLALPPALVPEVEVDVLSVHLALSDGWRLAGKITADPGHGVAGFPFAQEALHLAALLLGTEIPARLLGWAGAGLAALGAVALAEVLGATATIAWLAGAATFAMPQLFELAGHAKNDALATGLVTAALVALASGGRAGLATAGLLAGAAAATKLTAGLAIPAICGVLCLSRIMIRSAPHGVSKRSTSLLPVSLLHLSLFLFCALILLLPWSLRNLLTLGSPCFPALTGVFPVLGRSGVNEELMARYAFTWGDVRPGSFWGALRDLGRIVAGFSPVIGAGAILVAVTPASRRGAGWLGVFPLLCALIWLPTLSWVSRYLLPAAPALVALSVVPFGIRGRPAWLIGLTAASLAVCMAGGGWRARPLAAALGLESPAAYRARHLGPYAAALHEIAARVASAERVAVVGDWRRYPSGGRLIAGMSDDTPLLRSLAVAATDAARLEVKLRQRRIGWVLHFPSPAAYWADYAMRFAWTPVAARAWGDVWDARATLVWRSRTAQDVAGSAWLFRLARGRGDAPFAAWLPGTEGEYASLRLLVGSPQSAEALDTAIREIGDRFAGRAEFLARRAVIRVLNGDRMGAVRDLAEAVRAAPDAVPLWGDWGASVVPGEVWRRPDRLVLEFDRMIMDSARWSALFNLGIPFAVPALR